MCEEHFFSEISGSSFSMRACLVWIEIVILNNKQKKCFGYSKWNVSF